jgi:parallel beta-helix repeat protein
VIAGCKDIYIRGGAYNEDFDIKIDTGVHIEGDGNLVVVKCRSLFELDGSEFTKIIVTDGDVKQSETSFTIPSSDISLDGVYEVGIDEVFYGLVRDDNDVFELDRPYEGKTNSSATMVFYTLNNKIEIEFSVVPGSNILETVVGNIDLVNSVDIRPGVIIDGVFYKVSSVQEQCKLVLTKPVMTSASTVVGTLYKRNVVDNVTIKKINIVSEKIKFSNAHHLTLENVHLQSSDCQFFQCGYMDICSLSVLGNIGAQLVFDTCHQGLLKSIDTDECDTSVNNSFQLGFTTSRFARGNNGVSIGKGSQNIRIELSQVVRNANIGCFLDDTTKDCLISQCIIMGNLTNILIQGTGHDITTSYISGATQIGVLIEKGHRIAIRRNEIRDNQWNGLYVTDSDLSVVEGNDFSTNNISEDSSLSVENRYAVYSSPNSEFTVVLYNTFCMSQEMNGEILDILIAGNAYEQAGNCVV